MRRIRILVAGAGMIAGAGAGVAAAAAPPAPPAPAASAAPAAVPAAAHASVRHAPRCAAAAPSRLTFRRRLGRTVGMLRWRVPRAAAHRTPAPRYRVTRGHAVLGQTSKRALRVRVVLDRTYRFRVVALDAKGRRTRCATSRRVRVAYRVPGAPRFPSVEGGERGLHLGWKPARRGDAPLAGYRLVRDGKTVGQTTRTSWDLPAAPDRAYRFAVVAVDKAGRTSRPSATVTATTSHAAPTAPGGLDARAVSESQIGIGWQPSSVRAGRIVGYRVLRDGAVVRQLAATSTVLDRLAASTSYRVAVVAVDDHGYVSAPAEAVVRTQDPVPTSGHAHAYLLASTDQSFADFRAHYRQIGAIHPTYFDCTGAAALEGRDDPLVTQWAQARRVEVLARVNCQRTAVVDRILTDPATRAAWLDQLVALAAAHRYDGISLDFEAGPAQDRGALTSFVDELASRLHAAGRTLAVAVSSKTSDSLTHPRSGIYDYAQIAEAADYVYLMAWGLHWSSSTPGPQDDIAWVRQVVDYVKTIPQRHKFIFGTNLYALDWPDGGGPQHVADAYEYQDIVPRLPQLGAQIHLDPATDNWQATYLDAAGRSREVWYPDADTTARRVRIAKDAGLGGIGFWRLGREDQRIWNDPLLAPGAPW